MLARLPLFAVALLLALWPAQAFADARAQRPLQLQIDLLGYHVGYHFNETFYLGFTHQSNIESRRFDSDQERYLEETEMFDQKGVDNVDTTIGSRQSLELRISPFVPGVYFALGVLVLEGDKQEVDFDRRARIIGDSAYNDTDLLVTVAGKQATAPALGVGFNHVFDNGVSLGLGLLLAVLDEGETPDVTITTNNPAVTAADLKQLQKDIEDEHRFNGMFHLAFGYNF
jgi:hypothetical protein